MSQIGVLPLHIAAENEASPEVVKLLIEANPQAASTANKVCPARVQPSAFDCSQPAIHTQLPRPSQAIVPSSCVGTILSHPLMSR